MLVWNMRSQLRKLNLMNFFLSLFFISPVAMFFYRQRGLDLTQVLFLESVLSFCIVLFEVPTGIVADKFGRKRSILMGIGLFGVELVLTFFARGFLMFTLVFALMGIAVTFMTGSVEALIYDTLKEQNKTCLMKRAMGSYGFYSLTGKFIALVIGGYVGRSLSPDAFNLLIGLNVACVLVAFIVALTIRDNEDKAIRAQKDPPMRLLSRGIALISENKKLARIVFLSIFTSPFLFAFKYLSQENFKAQGVDIAVMGAVFAFSCLASAIAQKCAHKIERLLGMKRAVLLVTILPGILYVSMAFIPSPAWLISSFVLVRAFEGAGVPLF